MPNLVMLWLPQQIGSQLYSHLDDFYFNMSLYLCTMYAKEELYIHGLFTLIFSLSYLLLYLYQTNSPTNQTYKYVHILSPNITIWLIKIRHFIKYIWTSDRKRIELQYRNEGTSHFTRISLQPTQILVLQSSHPSLYKPALIKMNFHQ